LFDDHRVPRQVEEYEARTELEVPPLATAFCGEEDGWPALQAELSDLDVPLARGEILVKQAGTDLHLMADGLLEGLEGLAVGDEDERLVVGIAPALGGTGQPGDARIGSRNSARFFGEATVVRSEDAEQRIAAGECAADTADLAFTLKWVVGGLGAQVLDELVVILPGLVIVEVDGAWYARWQAADVVTPRRAGARRKRLAAGEAGLEVDPFRKLVGSQELQQAEEAVGVVLERGRAQQHCVARGGGERGGDAVLRIAWMAGRPPQVVGLVNDDDVEAGLHRQLGEPGLLHQCLDGHDHAMMGIERVESLAVFAVHVLKALFVQQHEDLVVLAPQLAEPLHDQGSRGDDERAVGPAPSQQVVQDQAGLDGLAQSDLVGQQPADRVGAGGRLGHVKLVRKEPDAPTEEGAQAVRLAHGSQVQGVQPQGEGVQGVDVTVGQPVAQRVAADLGPEGVGFDLTTALQQRAALSRQAGNHHRFACRLQDRAHSGPELQRAEGIGVQRQAQRGVRGGEVHDQRALLDKEDPAGPQIGVEAVKKPVAGLPVHGGGRRWYQGTVGAGMLGANRTSPRGYSLLIVGKSGREACLETTLVERRAPDPVPGAGKADLQSDGPVEDRDLIVRAQSGETAAFGELVERYMRRAYYSALGLVGSHDDALDLSQEAFARAYRARHRINPDLPFYAWLYQIIRRLCFNHTRDRRSHREKIERASNWLVEQADRRSTYTDPHRAMVREEERRRVTAAIDLLPDREREVLVLKEFEGLRYREIAHLLGIPIGTVMSRLYTARKRLAGVIEEQS
jgi:RNA polymerase sigma-70 factor (ECF subfamily)